MTNISDVIATNSPFIQIRETSCCDVIENIPEGWDLSIPLSYKAARLQSQDLASGETFRQGFYQLQIV